jgi:hypothetical protein
MDVFTAFLRKSHRIETLQAPLSMMVNNMMVSNAD